MRFSNYFFSGLLVLTSTLATGCHQDFKLPNPINRIMLNAHVEFPDHVPAAEESLQLTLSLSGEGTVFSNDYRNATNYGVCSTVRSGPFEFAQRTLSDLTPDANGTVRAYYPVSALAGVFDRIPVGFGCHARYLNAIESVKVVNVQAEIVANERTLVNWCESSARSGCTLTRASTAHWSSEQRSCYEERYNRCYSQVHTYQRLIATSSIYADEIMPALERGDASVHDGGTTLRTTRGTYRLNGSTLEIDTTLILQAVPR